MTQVVDEKEHPERPIPTKPLITQHKDGDGMHYIVAAEIDKRFGTSPRVDVWWNRGPRKRVASPINHQPMAVEEEELIIRQENGRVGADVLIITHGQVYDLIDALCRAVENP